MFIFFQNISRILNWWGTMVHIFKSPMEQSMHLKLPVLLHFVVSGPSAQLAHSAFSVIVMKTLTPITLFDKEPIKNWAWAGTYKKCGYHWLLSFLLYRRRPLKLPGVTRPCLDLSLAKWKLLQHCPCLRLYPFLHSDYKTLPWFPPSYTGLKWTELIWLLTLAWECSGPWLAENWP